MIESVFSWIVTAFNFATSNFTRILAAMGFALSYLVALITVTMFINRLSHITIGSDSRSKSKDKQSKSKEAGTE